MNSSLYVYDVIWLDSRSGTHFSDYLDVAWMHFTLNAGRTAPLNHLEVESRSQCLVFPVTSAGQERQSRCFQVKWSGHEPISLGLRLKFRKFSLNLLFWLQGSVSKLLWVKVIKYFKKYSFQSLRSRTVGNLYSNLLSSPILNSDIHFLLFCFCNL